MSTFFFAMALISQTLDLQLEPSSCLVESEVRARISVRVKGTLVIAQNAPGLTVSLYGLSGALLGTRPIQAWTNCTELLELIAALAEVWALDLGCVELGRDTSVPSEFYTPKVQSPDLGERRDQLEEFRAVRPSLDRARSEQGAAQPIQAHREAGSVLSDDERSFHPN